MAIAFLVDFSLPHPLCDGQTQDLRRIVFDFAWLSTIDEAEEATWLAHSSDTYNWLRNIFGGYPHLSDPAWSGRAVQMLGELSRASQSDATTPAVLYHLARHMHVDCATHIQTPLSHATSHVASIALGLLRNLHDIFPHMSLNDLCLRHARMSARMWLTYACNDVELLSFSVQIGQFTVADRLHALLIWHQIQLNVVNVKYWKCGDHSIDYAEHAEREQSLLLADISTSSLIERGAFPILIARAIRDECEISAPFRAFGNAYRAGLVKEITHPHRWSEHIVRRKRNWIHDKAGQYDSFHTCGWNYEENGDGEDSNDGDYNWGEGECACVRVTPDEAADIWDAEERWNACDARGARGNYNMYRNKAFVHMWRRLEVFEHVDSWEEWTGMKNDVFARCNDSQLDLLLLRHAQIRRYGGRLSERVRSYKLVDKAMFAARKRNLHSGIEWVDKCYGQNVWNQNDLAEFYAHLALDTPWFYSCHTRSDFETLTGSTDRTKYYVLSERSPVRLAVPAK